MFNLLNRLIRRHLLFLAAASLLLCGFEFMLCALVSTFNIPAILTEVMKSLPPAAQNFISEQVLAGMTTRGLLAFGWNHPVTLALGAAVAIVPATRAIAGEIESGGMELLLSQPLARWQYLNAQVAFALFAIAALSAAGMIGTLAGQRTFALGLLELRPLVQVVFNFFLLQSAWFGLTLLLSVFGRESGHVVGTAFFLALVSYIVQVLGKIWPVMAGLLPFSLYNYYSSQDILVQNHFSKSSVAILASVFLTGVGLAMWRFQRRDIP